MADEPGKVRLDKWLWAARFYKTRGLSSAEVDKGRVKVNGQTVKPGREVRVGDVMEIRTGPATRTIEVLALSSMRGPAAVAALLFRETPASIAARAAAAERQRLAPEPALTLSQGRPSKKDRRTMDEWRQVAGGKEPRGWNERWSASIED